MKHQEIITEVIQMYVSAEDSQLFRPVKELKGFNKVYLQPKESITVEIPFDDKSFRYYNVKANKWEVEGGAYKIQIGSNIQDIKLEVTVWQKGTDAPNPYDKAKLQSYYRADVKQIEDKEFEKLLGHTIPDSKWQTNQLLTINDAVCQMYYAKSRLARFALRVITYLKDKSMEKGEPNLNLFFIYDIPFRGIAKMMGGAVSLEMAEAILEIVNGHFFRGVKNLVKGALNNRKK